MIVGLLAMLFILISAYIVLARNDRQSLRMVAQSEQVTEIMESLYGVIEGAITDADGGDRVTGTAYVDAPGLAGVVTGTNTAWGSPWLASPEPVLAPSVSATIAEPAHYRVPAVTSVSGGASGTVLLTNLLVDANRDGDSTNDLAANALLPFMDADGDGIPDASFAASAVLTELANSIAGRAVSATGINPADLDPSNLPDTNVRRWEQFDQQARYEVAAKVVSHGGMVQVSQSLSAQMWNSGFLYGMFAWVQHPSDSGAPTYQQLYNMYAQSAAIEPILRRRGGLLPEARGLAAGNVPPALSAVYEDFGNTFTPLALSGKTGAWQRFNLADQTDWRLWRQAATIDPEQYYLNPIVQRNAYASRQVLTTVNNSDELARINRVKQLDPNQPPLWDGRGLLPGTLKFYLGRITDPVSGAFNADGTYNDTRGPRIVYELAAYFYEMLSAHKGWRAGAGTTTEAVSQMEQALMLAVNTVAFAAPHDATDGHVDTVYMSAATLDKAYFGFAPQPFITQVIAYNETDTPGQDADIALAVELYNPYDRDPGGSGRFDLDLSYFALSINDEAGAPGQPLNMDPAVFGILSTTGVLRLAGREFFVCALNSGSNSFFNDQAVAGAFVLDGSLPTLSVPYSTQGDNITVKLWRSNRARTMWYVVDEMELKTAGLSTGDLQTDKEGYITISRDTTYEPYLGIAPSGLTPHARWRMTMSFPKDDTHNNSNYTDGQPLATTLAELRTGDLMPSTAAAPTMPCVPLYTMNADPGATVFIHGMARVPSFPTTGFMLFVPRFCHTSSTTERRPASVWLYEQWEERGLSIASVPADFGHMPIFDNRQEENSNAGGFNRLGKVPWGLLVFDYFTTLNPNGPDNVAGTPDDVDPYRVPGRININSASWYVMAGLPLIGPMSAAGFTTSNLPLSATAAPAFWSYEAGVLAGEGWDRRPRCPTLVDRSSSAGGQWYRLGPYLAQAVTAYRDRVPYARTSTSYLADAWYRNDGNGMVYRTATVYGTIRAGAPERGFLTIGELANVMGFDSTDPRTSYCGDFTAGGPTTVLEGAGGYLSGGGGDFMKAVSLLALLDTNFLTTRSNTFTIYVSLTDRVNPQSSVRSQVTIDRTNLLPRLVWEDRDGDLYRDPWQDPADVWDPYNPTDYYSVLPGTGRPEIIGQREVSYFNARYDE